MGILPKKLIRTRPHKFSPSIGRKIRGSVVALLLGMLLLYGTQGVCQPVYREEVVQSAILFSIAQFVEWPGSSFSSDSSPLSVCVFGEDLLQKELMKWQERSYFGRPIEITVLTNFVELQKTMHKYQILYIADKQWSHSKEILSLIKSLPILSASDDDNFFKNGGIVSFVEVGGRVNFCLNLDISAKNNLKISSKLFGLSLSIIKNGSIMEQR